MILRRLFATFLVATLCATASAADWPGFRGADGLAAVSADDAKNLPTDFDGASGKLIRWKIPLPLAGESSPIVAGNRVFITGADDKKRVLFCYDGDSGKLLWQQAINAGGKIPGDPGDDPPPAGLAAPTPASDGKIVACLFANGDLAAFDLEGNQLWARNLGVPESGYGFASSPVVHGNKIIIQFDQGTEASDEKVESSLFAIDIATGKTLWQTKRPVRGSWSTPIVISAHDKTQIITVASPLVIAYSFDTGEELWRADCMGRDVAPSAAFANDIVYATVARSAITAIKTDGKGDVTGTHVLWKNEDDQGPEVPSPATNGKQVFIARDGGTVAAQDAGTGKLLWEQNLETPLRSSPTLVGDQLWLFDRNGTLHRLAAGAEAKVLGSAALGEKTDAQPAYAGGRIYVRGKENLYCIGK